MKNRIDVVCCFDSNFVRYAGVMLTSLLENNKNNYIVVHAIVESIKNKDKKLLQSIFEKYQRELKYYDISSEMSSYIDSFPLKHTHISKATYFRILMAKILPDDLSKVLYLDCDLIVKDDLLTLFQENIEDFALGACKELGDISSHIKRLNIPNGCDYFCAGIMLVNLLYWRNNSVSERSFKYLHDNYEKCILWWDQDALNGCLFKEWKCLHARYNCDPQMFFYDGWIKYNEEESKEWLEAVRDPAIIHYLTAAKPWSVLCSHPCKNLYFEYLEKTPWRRVGLKRPSFYKQIRIVLRFLILGKLPNTEGFNS